MGREVDSAPVGNTQKLGRRLFSFAVIADTHVNQEEGKASSDFAVNALSNARNRFVIQAINRAAPAFTLHLGDIVHPTPIHPGYVAAAAAFHALAAELECPLHLAPGNHDVGDKPGDWLPVPSVNDEFLAMYRRQFGSNFHSFSANGCHFVIIDAQVINSGLACEEEQRRWLEADLASHAGERTFLCTHYPPYLHDASEEGHYDNLDEPGRAWLLALIERYKVEAVFAGHVHNFWYHLHGETEIYLLPSTAFVRLDYSELFRIEPAPERGRNDAPKLGFLLVEVRERGHVAHAIRTYGCERAPGSNVEHNVERVAPVHTKSVARAPLGIDLRYPWAEKVEVAASGALDEFGRKWARNDYPLMSLWEMGICRLRVPLGDLVNPDSRERMRVLQRVGHRFTVYTHGIPAGPKWAALREGLHLVDAWEIVAPVRNADQLVAAIRELSAIAPIKVHLSKLQRHDSTHHHGNRARHVIQHGFALDEGDEVRELLRRSGLGEALDGVQFRVDCDRAPWEDVSAIASMMKSTGRQGHAYVRLAANNPSVAMEDDLANANRVAETMLAGLAHPAVGLVLDTFSDVDRGYFPRTGLVDRRYNPRMAGHVCRNLHGVFDASSFEVRQGRSCSVSGARAIAFAGEREQWVAVLPSQQAVVRSLPIAGGSRDVEGRGRRIDLITGVVDAVAWTAMESDGEVVASLREPVSCLAPTLFCLPRRMG